MNNALSNFSICDLYNYNQAIREVFISHLKTLMLHLSPIAPKSLISCSAFFTFFIPSTFLADIPLAKLYPVPIAIPVTAESLYPCC